eukprot:Gb_14682 [translate_table: standard]
MALLHTLAVIVLNDQLRVLKQTGTEADLEEETTMFRKSFKSAKCASGHSPGTPVVGSAQDLGKACYVSHKATEEQKRHSAEADEERNGSPSSIWSGPKCQNSVVSGWLCSNPALPPILVLTWRINPLVLNCRSDNSDRNLVLYRVSTGYVKPGPQSSRDRGQELGNYGVRVKIGGHLKLKEAKREEGKRHWKAVWYIVDYLAMTILWEEYFG